MSSREICSLDFGVSPVLGTLRDGMPGERLEVLVTPGSLGEITGEFVGVSPAASWWVSTAGAATSRPGGRPNSMSSRSVEESEESPVTKVLLSASLFFNLSSILHSKVFLTSSRSSRSAHAFARVSSEHDSSVSPVGERSSRKR